MRVLSYFNRPTLMAALAALITAGTALADHDGGRGGRGGDGGGGGGSSRSFSGGGGGGGGSSSRSFSSGGGGSSRSFSGGGGGGSSSMRSFSDGNSGSSSSRSYSIGSGGGDNGSSPRSFSFGNGGGDRSIRSSSSSGDQSARSISSGSISSGSNRVLGNVTGDNSPPIRTYQSTDSDRSRSFSGSSNGNNKGIGSIQSDQSTAKSFQGDSNQGSFRKTDGRSNVEMSQQNSYGGGKFQLYGKSSGDGQPLQSSQMQSDKGGRNFQAHRASGDEVRNFLNLRGNDTARLAENEKGKFSSKGPGDGNVQNLVRNRDNGGRDNNNHDGNDASRKVGAAGAADTGNRFKFDGNKSDHANGPGNHDGKDIHAGDQGKGHDGPGLGNHIGGDGKGVKHNGGDQNFHGNDAAKGEFSQWSKTWNGKHGDGHDHRDWSGKWKNGDRFDVANHVRGDWHGRRDHDNFPFRGGWWGHGHGWGFWDDCAFRFNRPFYWWGWSSCPVLTSWCGFGWDYPYYWDYGPGEYIYCNNGVVYVNGAWYEPAPVFYQQTLRLIDQAPALTPDAAAQQEWLPLGVFACTPDGLHEADVLVQLAVTKDGVIGGTVFDQKGGTTYPVQGTVDKNSQRAMWSYTNNKNVRVVMETSVNNLTQNESTGLVHYGPNDQRVVELVRLQDPSNDPAANAAANGAANAAAPGAANNIPAPLPIPPPEQ